MADKYITFRPKYIKRDKHGNVLEVAAIFIEGVVANVQEVQRRLNQDGTIAETVSTHEAFIRERDISEVEVNVFSEHDRTYTDDRGRAVIVYDRRRTGPIRTEGEVFSFLAAEASKDTTKTLYTQKRGT